MAENVYQLLHTARLRLRHSDLCQFPDAACNCGLDDLKQRLDERLAEPEACPACEGDGEVSHGSCSIPDCEHAEDCSTCGGSGKLPTPEEIAELREECESVRGDLVATEAELAAYKDRDSERPHPFDERVAAAVPDHLVLNVQKAHAAIMTTAKERDDARAEVERMRPLCEAAIAWSRAIYGERHPYEVPLEAAVDAYVAAKVRP